MLATGWPVLRHYFDKSNLAYVIVLSTKMADWEKILATLMINGCTLNGNWAWRKR
jgi:hypothetical protein